MSTSPAKVTTVDRILDASLKLFNEQGFHCVPAMRIAEHLGISPGHLAYHFKSKSDILIGLFPRMEKALQEFIQVESHHVPPASIERTLNILKTLWQFRFFFIELPQLAPVDRKITDTYLKLEERILDTMQATFKARIAEGIMRPVPLPNTTALLAKTVWITWLDFIRREQLRHPGQITPEREEVYEAALRGYCVIQPYFPPKFLDEVATALKQRLEKAESAPAKGAKKTAAAPAKKRRAKTA